MKRVIRIPVKRVNDPVTETVEIGVTVSQFQDLINQRIPTFNRTVGNPDTIIDTKGINDLLFLVNKSASQLFK